MNKTLLGDEYVKQVIDVVELIAPLKAEKSSILSDTTHFFINDARSTRHQLDLKVQIAAAQDKLAEASEPSAADEQALQSLIAELEQAKQNDDNERQKRLNRVRQVCLSLYELCEGQNHQETQQKTAKFLATLWFLSEQIPGKVQALHQRLKAPYKMATTLRLVDAIIGKGIIDVPNWGSFDNPLERYKDEDSRHKWFASVAVPVMTAALFQDSGLQHPLAIKLLNGQDGKADPFRVLDSEERISLLKMNYRFSVDYVTIGLGVDYATHYASPEQQILAHATTLELVKDAYKPDTGIGQLLKIPQIYTSVVFSTKAEYKREDVPKGCMLVDQLGKKGVLNSQLAKAFNSITGLFPQGFGILMQDTKGIVLGLNPKKMYEPTVLPLLTKDDKVLQAEVKSLGKSENFYFTDTRKKYSPAEIAKIETLVKLRPEDEPSHWLASDSMDKWYAAWQAL